MNDELKLGTVFLVCCAFMWFYAIPEHIQGSRAALYPKALVAAMLVICCLMLIKGFRIRGTDLEGEKWRLLTAASVRSLAVVPVMLVYIYLIEIVGFYTITGVFIVVYMLYFGARKPLSIILFATLLPLIVYLIIGEILSFPFPSGLFY